MLLGEALTRGKAEVESWSPQGRQLPGYGIGNGGMSGSYIKREDFEKLTAECLDAFKGGEVLKVIMGKEFTLTLQLSR